MVHSSTGRQIIENSIYPGAAALAGLGMSYYRSSRFNRMNGRGRSTARRGKYRSAGSRTTTRRNRKKSTAGVGVTGQYDRKMVYLRKRMPRRKRVAWRRFKQKVNAVAEKDLGSNTVLFNTGIVASNTTAGNQLAFTLGLYGQQSAVVGLNDLTLLSNLGNESNPTLVDGVTLDLSTKYMFQSAVLDVTLQNVSTFTSADGTTVTNPSEARLEVDVYEVTMRRPSMRSSTQVQSIFDALDYNATFDRPIKDNNATPSTTEISPRTRGATPFEFGTSIGYWGLKIWKKTKFILSQGETMTYQIRDPRRHVVERTKIKDTLGCNQQGMSKFLYITGKIAPGANDVGIGTNGKYQEILKIGSTRKYLYKVEGQNEDRTLVINGK